MILAFFLALTAGPVQDPAPSDTVRPHRLPEVSVIGAPNRLKLIPGSGTVLDARSIVQVQSRSLNEVLHRVPGVHVRDEEGIGLRPNIGLRGLNPTRSTTVLLLEDGVPISLAPYGDNGSYYVPPIDRFEGVFRRGRREGPGRYDWPAGQSYQGNYVAGLPNGQGTVTIDGAAFAGTWRRGCLTHGDRRIAIGVPLSACGGGGGRLVGNLR